MVLEVLTQTRNHLFSYLTVKKLILESKEGRSLHCVENFSLEISVFIEESGSEIFLCSCFHILIDQSIPACSCCHLAHHSGIDCPI